MKIFIFEVLLLSVIGFCFVLPLCTFSIITTTLYIVLYLRGFKEVLNMHKRPRLFKQKHIKGTPEAV